MLKKEQVEALGKLLGIDNLAAAIADEKEVDIAIPEAELYTAEQLTTLKANERKSAGAAAVEIAVKDFKAKAGLEFTGKTLDGLATAISEKALADAKIEPEKKVKELQDKLATVQATATEFETKLKAKDDEIASVKLHGELVKAVPGGTLLEPDEIITLMKAKGYEFKQEDGKMVVYKDGEPQRDKLANALPVADVVKTFATEKKLIGEGDPDTKGGRGGAGKPAAGGAITSASQLAAKYKADGKNLQGAEFMDELNRLAAANKEFVMDTDKI